MNLFYAIKNRSLFVQWAMLIFISLCVTFIFEFVNLPAPLMLGPMVGAILLTTVGCRVRLAGSLVSLSQAIIGCLIATSFTMRTINEFAKQAPIYVCVALSILAFSGVLGFTASRMRVLSGTTGIWGVLPGAAPVMILMSEQYGADPRLVAFMQYIRVVVVAIMASIVIRIFGVEPAEAEKSFIWFPNLALAPFIKTLLIMVASLFFARFIKLPAGVFLLSLFIGSLYQVSGFGIISTPPWLLALGYALLGWSIGLRFTPDVWVAAAETFIRCLSLLLAMIIFCGVLAFLLVHFFGVSPLTAYLATSPGGVDSIAIIASGANVDMPFIMVSQIFRFLLLLILGPMLSRAVAYLAEKAPYKLIQKD